MKTIFDTFQKFIRCPDGQEIFYWGITPKNPYGTLIILHGLGEHSGRYDDFANFLASNHWAVRLYDQRGHGKTPGIRAYVENFETLVDDLDFIVDQVHEESGSKPYLLGHSFGGQVAINFLAKHAKKLSGAILSSPNIRLAMQVFWLKRFLGKYLSMVLPSLSIPNDIDPRLISHDKKVVAKYSADPLVAKKITLRLGDELLQNLEMVPELAAQIRLPLMIFHGSEDGITSVQGSKEFYQNLGSKDKTLKIYDGFFHETLNEIGRKEVYQNVIDWLKKHRHEKRKTKSS